MSFMLRTRALLWADWVVEGTFFVMQTYLTDVREMSFIEATTFLNIWAGIYRISPLFFLFIADTILGNFKTLGLSAIFNTTGLVVITVIARGGYKCDKKKGAESSSLSSSCAGHTEKGFFIFGMALIALGRAARLASLTPFVEDQMTDELDLMKHKIAVIVAVLVPAVAFFAFPYVKEWYLLWGVGAICTGFAGLAFFCSFKKYKKPGPRAEGSPVTAFVRVFVASALNMFQPSPKLDDPRLYVDNDDEEFKELSTSRLLGFLHKAAIKVEDDDDESRGDKKRSWRLCSVSEVESAKILIRMVPSYSTFLICGVVLSIGNTYFVEQATHMEYNIGRFTPPLQLLQLIFIACKFLFNHYTEDLKVVHESAVAATTCSIVCCTVAAAIDRRRVHVVRKHGLINQPDDATVPMSAYWLLFQVSFLGILDALVENSLRKFHMKEAPKSMGRYNRCLMHGVIGLGFMCGAISVYVVGKFSQIGSGKGWFQDTLNKSRLDRYYWALSGFASLNLILCIVLMTYIYMKKTTLSSAGK